MIITATQGKAGVRNRNEYPPTLIRIIFFKKDRNEITHTASSEVVGADGPDGAVGFELCGVPRRHWHRIWARFIYGTCEWHADGLKLRCSARVLQK
jgi:hypothetical protein